MLPVLLTALVALGLPTLYLAIRNREFRKFLAGAFFVGAGIQFYLYLANVSVPLLGTSLVFTPEISGWRSVPIPSFSCCASISDLSPGRKTRPCRRGLSNGAAESVCRAPFSDRSANNGTIAHQLLAINRLEDGAQGRA
jgi:hypothetical protein